MPVYTTISVVEPVSTLALNWEDQGSPQLDYVLPTYLNGVAWRVCSIDLSITSASQIAIILRLYGGALTGSSTSGSEVTSRTRPFTVSGAPTQIKVKNSKRVQHASTSSGVTLASLGALGPTTTAVVTVSGIIIVSIRGGL